MKRITAAAALLITGLAGCGVDLDADEVHSARAFPYSGTTLTIESALGGLRIMPATGPGIQVDRWLRGKAADDNSWSLQDGRLRLGADCTVVFGDCGARYHVRVPPGVRLVVDGGDDGVVLRDLPQDVDVSTSGPIRAYDTSGRLRLRTGDSLIAGSRLRSASVRARTSTGPISLSFAVRPDGLDARSRDGRVTATVPRGDYAVTARSTHGRVRSQLKDTGGSRTIVARSTTGDVRLVSP
ncbi:hypothetical protein [Nonomuraea sp. SBT364]|uniref:hypothetical protein n=1 Tax=Nonomuraea sp. SBT364 TaxID=1580530 RepID=UPI00066C7053|nr:hypothetical protein [Nonomuraea sp. SBT364]